MKKLIITILSIFILSVSVKSEGDIMLNDMSSNQIVNINMLRPITPMTATFEDDTITTTNAINIKNIAPITPKVATFDE